MENATANLLLGIQVADVSIVRPFIGVRVFKPNALTKKNEAKIKCHGHSCEQEGFLFVPNIDVCWFNFLIFSSSWRIIREKVTMLFIVRMQTSSRKWYVF